MTSPACSDAARAVQRGDAFARISALLVALLRRSSRRTRRARSSRSSCKDIRVEGVQRTEAGTVFSYLPVKVGDRIDDAKAAQAVKALFATGLLPRRAARGDRTAC